MLVLNCLKILQKFLLIQIKSLCKVNYFKTQTFHTDIFEKNSCKVLKKKIQVLFG